MASSFATSVTGPSEVMPSYSSEASGTVMHGNWNNIEQNRRKIMAMPKSIIWKINGIMWISLLFPSPLNYPCAQASRVM